jgi:hypothetical protein
MSDNVHSLYSDWNAKTIYVLRGSLNTNGNDINFTSLSVSPTAIGFNITNSMLTMFGGYGSLYISDKSNFTSTNSNVIVNTTGSSTSYIGCYDSNVTFNNYRNKNSGVNGVTIDGNNVFNTITVDANMLQKFAINKRQIVSNFVATGASDKNVKLQSNSNGSLALLIKIGGGFVSADYAAIKDLNVIPDTNTWYAGTHSYNISNNFGWIFTDPPVTDPCIRPINTDWNISTHIDCNFNIINLGTGKLIMSPGGRLRLYDSNITTSKVQLDTIGDSIYVFSRSFINIK